MEASLYTNIGPHSPTALNKKKILKPFYIVSAKSQNEPMLLVFVLILKKNIDTYKSTFECGHTILLFIMFNI